MDTYGQALLLVDRWLAQFALVAPGGPLKDRTIGQKSTKMGGFHWFSSIFIDFNGFSPKLVKIQPTFGYFVFTYDELGGAEGAEKPLKTLFWHHREPGNIPESSYVA